MFRNSIGDDLPFTQAALLRWGSDQLNQIEGANPRQDARILLEWALDAVTLFAVPELVPDDVATRYFQAIEQRRRRVPLQHLVGRMWFRHLTLIAQPGVFITRPETEIVAEEAIGALKKAQSRRVSMGRANNSASALAVDLCSGSGAIALSLACEVPGSKVIAVELSPDAVNLCQTNVNLIAPGRVDVIEGDATRALTEYDGQVDVVVSNPPYVPSFAIPQQPEALADPPLALYGGGEDGMIIPRGIVSRAASLLRPGGTLVIEHDDSQGEQMRALAETEGLMNIFTRVDLAGRDRMLIAQRPEE